MTRFLIRLTSSSYSSAISVTPLSVNHLHRDQFGFQKLLIAVTKGGKLYALDSANGNIVWTRNLGLFGETAQLEVIDMWVVREFSELGNPTLAILASRDGKVSLAHKDIIKQLLKARSRPSRSTSTASRVRYLATRPTLACLLARSYFQANPGPRSSCHSKTVAHAIR